MVCATSCWLWTLAGAVLAFNVLLWLERLYRAGKVSPKGKVVMVTGCDTGFGRSLAEWLHGLGFTVVAACLTPAATAELTTLFGSSGVLECVLVGGGHGDGDVMCMR
jgi:hypothetical protein